VVAIPGGILGQIFLVFLVGLVEFGVIDNRRFDGFLFVRLDFFVVDVGLELRLDTFGNFLLLGRRAKDDAPVLRSPIVALTVPSGRIVKAVKELHHVLEDFGRGRRLLRQLDAQDLDVARRTAAYLAVTGIFHSVGIGIHKADLGVGNDAGVPFLKVLDDVLFGAPVAACAECQCGCDGCHVFGVGSC